MIGFLGLYLHLPLNFSAKKCIDLTVPWSIWVWHMDFWFDWTSILTCRTSWKAVTGLLISINLKPATLSPKTWDTMSLGNILELSLRPKIRPFQRNGSLHVTDDSLKPFSFWGASGIKVLPSYPPWKLTNIPWKSMVGRCITPINGQKCMGFTGVTSYFTPITGSYTYITLLKK